MNWTGRHVAITEEERRRLKNVYDLTHYALTYTANDIEIFACPRLTSDGTPLLPHDAKAACERSMAAFLNEPAADEIAILDGNGQIFRRRKNRNAANVCLKVEDGGAKLFAYRDIPAGEELTWCYGALYERRLATIDTSTNRIHFGNSYAVGASVSAYTPGLSLEYVPFLPPVVETFSRDMFVVPCSKKAMANMKRRTDIYLKYLETTDSIASSMLSNGSSDEMIKEYRAHAERFMGSYETRLVDADRYVAELARKTSPMHQNVHKFLAFVLQELRKSPCFRLHADDVIETKTGHSPVVRLLEWKTIHAMQLAIVTLLDGVQSAHIAWKAKPKWLCDHFTVAYVLQSTKGDIIAWSIDRDDPLLADKTYVRTFFSALCHLRARMVLLLKNLEEVGQPSLVGPEVGQPSLVGTDVEAEKLPVVEAEAPPAPCASEIVNSLRSGTSAELLQKFLVARRHMDSDRVPHDERATIQAAMDDAAFLLRNLTIEIPSRDD